MMRRPGSSVIMSQTRQTCSAVARELPPNFDTFNNPNPPIESCFFGKRASAARAVKSAVANRAYRGGSMHIYSKSRATDW